MALALIGLGTAIVHLATNIFVARHKKPAPKPCHK